MKKLILDNTGTLFYCLVVGVLASLTTASVFIYIKLYLDTNSALTSQSALIFASLVMLQRFLMPLFTGASSYLYEKISANIERNIYQLAQTHIQNRSWLSSKDSSVGEFSQSINQTIQSTRTLFGTTLRVITSSGISIVVNILLIATFLNTYRSIFAAILVTAYLWIVIALMEKKKPLLSDLRANERALSKFIADGLLTKNNHGAAHKLRFDKFLSLSQMLFQSRIKNGEFMLANNARISALVTLVYSTFILNLYWSSQSLGSLVFSHFIFGAALYESNIIAANWTSIMQARTDLNTLNAYCASTSAVAPYRVKIKSKRPKSVGVATSDLGVEFSDGKKLTYDFKLTFVATELNFISGANGSGKSTILSFIQDAFMQGHLTEKKFLVTVSYADGDIISSNDASFSNSPNAAFVSQSDEFFNDTVYSNLKGDLGDLGDHEILDCLKALNSRFTTIEEIKETTVGELGATLSGGEKKKLSIARAIIQKPEIIFLDEPFNSLDEESIINLVDVLLNIKDDIIVVVVTHDRSMFDDLIPITKLRESTVVRTGETVRINQAA